MTSAEYFEHKELQEAAAAYAKKNGGHFFWEEPSGGFVYELDDAGYSPPEDATADQVLKDLKSGDPLASIWRKLDDDLDPEILY